MNLNINGVISINGIAKSCRIRNVTRRVGSTPLVEVELVSDWDTQWEKENPNLKKSNPGIARVIFNAPATIVV